MAEITVESYFRAGTTHAADFRADAAAGPIGCVCCGRLIVKCFVLSDGRAVGGDCAATITGDDSTRQRGEDRFALAARMPAGLDIDPLCFAEETIRIRNARGDRAAYLAASREGSRYSLGKLAKARIFDAARRAGVA
jgi:hypothetical protein